MAEKLRDVSPRDVEVRQQIGANVRRVRSSRGRTLKWLADEVGCSDATIARIEQGKQVISTDTLDRIAHALDTTTMNLYRAGKPRAAEG
jgi:transcriptional regulator with XRE-family HTH domain